MNFQTIHFQDILKKKKKRERYILVLNFQEKGEWLVHVSEGFDKFFQLIYVVEKPIIIPLEIKGSRKDEFGFIPITPIAGLTTLNERCVRLRFAAHSKNSDLLINLYKVKEGTFENDGKELNDTDYHCTRSKLELQFLLFT